MTDNTFPKARELRDAAKAALEGNTGRAALCTLIYVAISACGSMFSEFNEWLPTPVAVVLSMFAIGFAICITLPFDLGFNITFLRHVRGERPDDLPVRPFGMFRQYGRYVGTSALRMLYILLWALICIPVLVVGTIVFDAYPEDGALAVLVGIIVLVVFIASLIPAMVMNYAYALTPYIMHDEPQTSANDCIRKSRQMMNGYKWRLFCLDLSYIGWLLLVVITLGVMVMWVQPRIECAHAKFYEELKARQSVGELQ